MSRSRNDLVPTSAGTAPAARQNSDPDAISEVESGLDSAAVLRILARSWKMATLSGVLLSAAIGGFLWWKFPPVYRASAWLQVSSRPQYLAFTDQEQPSDTFMATQVALIRSPLVMELVVSRPEISRLEDVRSESAPGDWLSKEVQVKQTDRSELVELSLESSDPQAAAKIVNAVCDVYYNLCSADGSRRTQRMIELLEAEKGSRAEQVEKLRADVRTLAEQHPELVADSKSESGFQTSLSGIQNRLVALEVEREVLQVQYEADREVLDSGKLTVPADKISRAIQETSQYRRLDALLADREIQLAEAKSVAARGSDEPHLRQLAGRVDAYRKRLDELGSQLRPRVTAQLRQRALDEHRDRLARATSSIAEHSRLEERLRLQLKNQLSTKQNPGASSLDFNYAKAELARAESIFQQISNRAEALRTEMNAPQRVSILRAASTPVKPKPVSYAKMAALTLGGFLFPFACIVFLESQKRRIGEAQQITQDAKLNVLGEITSLPSTPINPARRLSRRAEKHRRIFDESIDAIRTRLSLADESKDMQVLAVASAVSGEGKTRLASHLAASLARTTSEQVLLIDADLRAPEVHDLFKISNEVGLVDVLDGGCVAGEAIVTSWRENLHVMPAGKLVKNPYVLLGGESFPALLDEMRLVYRYVIIDAPPLLAASESLIIASAADGTLLCAMRDVSRSPQVKIAYERLVAAGAKPLGAVLSGVPVKRYEYMYGAYNYATSGVHGTLDVDIPLPPLLIREPNAARADTRRPK